MSHYICILQHVYNIYKGILSFCMTVFVCMQVGVRKYVCALEKAVIAVCKSFGVNPTTAEETGVWVNDCKICSVGR